MSAPIQLPGLAPDYATAFEAGAMTHELPELGAAHTFVTIIGPRALKTFGNRMMLIGQAPKSGTCGVDNTYVGPLATAATHAWNFSAAYAYLWDAAAAILFNDPAQPRPGDELAFAFTNALGLALASNVASGSRVPLVAGLGDDVMTFFKSGVSQADSTAKDADYGKPLRGVMAIYNRIDVAP